MRDDSTEIIRKRYLGCLLGLAVGNALGLPVEGWSAESIKQKYGSIKDIQIEKFGIEGSTDDDTEMMLAIAESYIEKGDFDISDITTRFIYWFTNDAGGVGIHTRRVLSLIESGVEPLDASRRIWESTGQQAAGNGGLMRCSPTALIRIDEPDKLDYESREISRITHFDPRSAESCVLLNRLIACCLKGIHREPEDCCDNLNDERIKITIKKIRDGSKNDLSVSGFVLDTLSAAIWAYAEFNDFENALVEVVNLGGDTDTNAAVTGALLGAKFGVDSIPQRWLGHLGNIERIEKAAAGLLNLARRNKPL